MANRVRHCNASRTSLIGRFVKGHNTFELPKSSNEPAEDPMCVLRPKPGECLDYNLSQTSIQMDAGETKIHFRETQGTFEPTPAEMLVKKPKKIKRNPHGVPPQWIFIDEKWRMEQEKLQKVYRKELKSRIKKRKLAEKAGDSKLHCDVQNMVGPKWFQELAPNQIKCVEKLRCAIIKDYKDRTVANTVELIDYLGVNPRPKNRKFEIALKQCLGSPVEFLLALFAQIRKDENNYTINERLLLSAVAHLTLTITMREMHIRTPSPPPQPKAKPIRELKPKPRNYKSPYLVPYTFQPEPPKYSGIYENTQIQYPESTYFSYIPQLRSDMIIGDVEFGGRYDELVEREIIEELLAAQTIYNRRFKNRMKLKLLKASIWKDFFVIENPMQQREDEGEDLAEEEMEEGGEIIEKVTLNKFEDDDFDLDIIPSDVLSVVASTNFEEIDFDQLPCSSNCKMQLERYLESKCPNWEQIKRRQFNSVINSGFVMRGDEDVTCSCVENYKQAIATYEYKCEIKRQQNVLQESALVLYCIGSVCITKNGPIYTINALKPLFHIPQLENNLNEVRTMQNNFIEYEANQKIYFDEKKEIEDTLRNVVERREGLKGYLHQKFLNCNNQNMLACSCLDTYNSQLNLIEFTMNHQRARNYLMAQKAKFSIGGVICKSNVPVYIISSAYPIANKKRYRDCLRYLERFKETLTKREPKFKFIGEQSCPECVAVTEQYLDEMVKVSAIKLPIKLEMPKEEFELPCKCKEETEKQLELLCTCPCDDNKPSAYIKSGVKITKSDKKINIIDGVHDKPCTCLPDYKDRIEKLENYKKRIQARYKLASQNEKFIISGVCQTAKGPIYNISSVLTPGYCCCAKYLDEERAIERHRKAMPKVPDNEGIKYTICGVKETPNGNVFILGQTLDEDRCICMRVFERFQHMHSFCMNTFTKFEKHVKECVDSFKNEAESLNKKEQKEDKNISEDVKDLVKKTRDIILSKKSTKSTVHEICSCESDIISSKHNISENNTCSCDEDSDSSDEEPIKAISINIEPEKINIIKSEKESTKPSTKTSKSSIARHLELKRYMILKEFPCKENKQMRILKKLLKCLADDGYPLAKLPDSFRLPHFKLWFQLRCGKFWTQKDRVQFLKEGKRMWKHTDTCRVKLPTPELPLSKHEATQLTWAQSKFCKKIVQGGRDEYYRFLKHSAIESNREFFPTLFTYEFPNPTFRDVFFSYAPTKELQVQPYKIVQSHEMEPKTKRLKCKIC